MGPRGSAGREYLEPGGPLSVQDDLAHYMTGKKMVIWSRAGHTVEVSWSSIGPRLILGIQGTGCPEDTVCISATGIFRRRDP